MDEKTGSEYLLRLVGFGSAVVGLLMALAAIGDKNTEADIPRIVVGVLIFSVGFIMNRMNTPYIPDGSEWPPKL